MFLSLVERKGIHRREGRQNFTAMPIIHRLSLLKDTKIVFSNNQLYDKLLVQSANRVILCLQ